MIPSHNRVLSMLFGLLFAASSPTIAGENGAGKNPPASSRPVLSPASKNAVSPATAADTVARSSSLAETPATPVVITTDRLFIKASRPTSTATPVVISIEPLVVQAIAQK